MINFEYRIEESRLRFFLGYRKKLKGSKFESSFHKNIEY